MRYQEILKHLKSLSNPAAREGMARYGMDSSKAYGVSIPALRKMAKEIGRNHHLAQELWIAGIRETMILASMIDDPESVTEEQMESWAGDFIDWETCDQCCMNLWQNTGYARQKCLEWSARGEEFIKRAGLVLMACLAVSDKKAGDDVFEEILPAIERESRDERTYVKKAANWALRQIGKRNPKLNQKAIKTARKIQQIDSKSAKWIASDALRELTSQAVQKRLRAREKSSRR